jgi:hypothetical protein
MAARFLRQTTWTMPEPYCLAMVLCDAAHRDPTTGKFTLLGTFSHVGSEQFPTKINLTIYFAVTDGLGPTKFAIQIVKASAAIVPPDEKSEDGGRIFGVKAQIPFGNPLDVIEQVLEIEAVIPEAGLYHCELWANKELLMTRRFLVQDLSGGEEEQHE